MRHLLFLATVLVGFLAGCVQTKDLQNQKGTQSGDPFAAFMPGTESCCIEIAPFDRVALFANVGVECPEGTTPGDELYTGFAPPATHTCECSCSSPTCGWAGGMHTNSEDCGNAEGSTPLPFGPSAGWSGTCSGEDPLPPDVSCGGLPCVQSVTVPPLVVSPCEPSEPEPVLPQPGWARVIKECKQEAPLDECGDGKSCVPLGEPGYDICLVAEGIQECPDGLFQVIYYHGVQDDRACEACSCSPPEAVVCSAYVQLYSHEACGSPVGSLTATSKKGGCVDMPPGAGLGSVKATFAGPVGGSCQPTGGDPVGTIEPEGPVTLCCREQLDIPE